jgi:hypothetical protein
MPSKNKEQNDTKQGDTQPNGTQEHVSPKNNIRPGVNVINIFPLLLMTRPNKLEGLSLETLSNQVLEFEGKARANRIGGPFRCFLLG